METQSYYQPMRSRVAVASSEAQLIVKLNKIWYPDRLPASQQAGSDLPIFLGALCFDVHAMAEHIHRVERIELAITFYVPWPDKISLVNVVNLNRFSEIRIFNAFRNVRSFF